MEASMNATTMTPLSDELISRCGSRAAAYDRDNRFFTEDFEELRAAGYLKMAVPEHLGGPGMAAPGPAGEGRKQPERPADHPRFSPPGLEGLLDQGDVGHAGYARDAERRHDPRGRLRAGPLHPPAAAGRHRRSFRAGDLRMGRADVRQHLSRPGRARPRPGGGWCQEAHVARPHPIDGV